MKSKLPDTGITIFSVMSSLAKEYDAINLSQGFPEFDCDPRLLKLYEHYLKNGYNQYAPMPGVSELRNALSKKIEKVFQKKIDPDTNITITAGATQAIYTAIATVVNPGDEVIMFDPSYDCYDPAVRLNGGVPIHLNLKFPDFAIPLDALKENLSERTKLIIINSPHNPTGAIISAEELRALEELCIQFDCYLISDEVYEHIYFDGLRHKSVIEYPELFKRSFVTFSFGKTFHATGWKLGYCVAPEHLTQEFRKIHQYLVFSCNTPAQMALADYIETESYVELPAFFEKKRDLFLNAISTSQLKPLPCSGTYFQLLSYEGISPKKDTDYAVELTKEHKVASIPISVFYEDGSDHKVLRFCFAKNDDTLLKAAEILCKI